MKLADWRKRNKMSLGALAKRAGLSKQSIFMLEKGRRIPNAETREKLLKATNGQVKPIDFVEALR